MASDKSNLPKEYLKKGGPGRPRGSLSGRAKALGVLDQILAEEKNLKKLRRSLQKKFNESPIKFFMKVIIPLMPKKVELETDIADTFAEWLKMKSTNGKDIN